MVCAGDVEIGLENPYSLLYLFASPAYVTAIRTPIEHYGLITFFRDVHAVSLSIVAAFSCFCCLLFFIAAAMSWWRELCLVAIQRKPYHQSIHFRLFSKISSWMAQSSDCCTWDGIQCDEITGHVVSIDLSNSALYGSINSSSSVFQLVRLQKLRVCLVVWWVSLNSHFHILNNITHISTHFFTHT